MSLIISVIFMSFLLVDSSNGKEVGIITKAKGRVQIIKENSFKGVNYKFFKGIVELKDIVRTKRRSYAIINFIDKSKVFLDENSRLIVEDYIPSKTRLYVSTGKVIYKIYKRVKGTFEVKTPTALIGVKGTEFLTFVKHGITIVIVKKGVVEVFNPEFPQVKIKLTKGTATVIKPKEPPKKPVKISSVEKFFKEKVEKFEKKEIKEYEKKEGKLEKQEKIETVEKERENLLEAASEEKGIEAELIEENLETITTENQNETVSTIDQEIIEIIREETQKDVANIIITGIPENLQIDVNIPPTKFPE